MGLRLAARAALEDGVESMTNPRFLALLAVMSVSFLLVALGMSAAGLRIPTIGFTAPHVADSMTLPSNLAVSPQLIAGFLAGWILRWLYAMPWADLPRAVAEWLLGWRRSVTMLALAVGCIAVLLLY